MLPLKLRNDLIPFLVTLLLCGVPCDVERVVRRVAGDPLSVDSVITEVNAISKTPVVFDIVPGLPATVAVPTYAGLPLGSTHTVADVRGEVDWAACRPA